MTVKLALLLGMLLPATLVAEEDWQAMDGAQIAAALTDRKVQYAQAWQEFKASGRTLYNADQDSWGYWRVERDQYCSQWPPSDLWACYDMARAGDRLRFMGPSGDVTEGVYADD